MRIAGTVFAGAALVAALVACAPREEATSPRARRAAAEAAAYAAALPFIENDYARALAAAKAKDLPIFVDIWVPW
ncbi:MAG TPA: hypothetical protein PKG80_06775 [Acidobacteriota bacterium]|nr:hypothetical protein [bacterium]HNX19960.1 hypothetical protein [Acidobacteriota bacterium]